MKKIVILSFILILLNFSQGFAGDQRYLGQLSSNPYDPDSVSNPYGRYGSPYSSDSINNPYGAGSRYKSDSPNNPYGEGLIIIGDD